METNLTRVVVVGHAWSVEDLCLAWNMRAQRTASRWLPIWVTPEWLANPRVIDALVAAADQEAPSLAEQWTGQESTIHLVSATLTSDELQSLVGQIPPSTSHGSFRCCIHDPSRMDQLFTSEFSVGDWTASVGVFSNGSAACATSDYREQGAFSYPEQLVSVASIENYWPPQGMHWLEPDGVSMSRAASDGLVSFLTAEKDPSAGVVSLETADGWRMVTDIAKRAGFDIEPSDKGRRGVGIMGLLEGDDGLAVLASSRIYDLLTSMIKLVGARQARQAAQSPVDTPATGAAQDGQFDRQHLDFETIHRELSPLKIAECESIVGWLVERRVLLRGLAFTCIRCRLKRWYPITRLSDSLTCDGCQHQSATAISVIQTRWRYRLNELFAHAVDQGVLPHLVTALRMNDNSPTFAGFYPGLDLKQAKGSARRPCEVDLFAIREGRAVIGECKSSAREFKEDEVSELVELGRQLNCSHVILATTDRNEMPPFLRSATNTITQPHVEVWSGYDLLDPHDGPPAEAEDESFDATYIKRIAKMIERRKLAQ